MHAAGAEYLLPHAVWSSGQGLWMFFDLLLVAKVAHGDISLEKALLEPDGEAGLCFPLSA